MRVRACTGCRKYIIIRPDNLKNEKKVKEFEKSHKGHTLVSLDLKEVEGNYENVERELDPEELLTKEIIQEELKKARAVVSEIRTFKGAFRFPMNEDRTPLMKYFERTAETHSGKYAIYEGKITKNYINWLEKQLVSQYLT